jgi:membrane protein implicated in regulation of membrane protease activity
MYLVAIAWGYVVLMMAAAEATGPNGTLLGAVITAVMYGVLPLSIVLYVLGTPARRRALRRAEAAEATASAAPVEPDGGGHAAGDPVAPERKEP